ncbi:hypothetical protein T492DRAFT_913924 [Pavlovales sp. CCMP2436]|nr:hypothetical protein T492DRAFT_913924 [Pavlovales sp. CCMP2436]
MPRTSRASSFFVFFFVFLGPHEVLIMKYSSLLILYLKGPPQRRGRLAPLVGAAAETPAR